MYKDDILNVFNFQQPCWSDHRCKIVEHNKCSDMANCS